MENLTPTSRKPKSQGITKGRSKKKIIKKRLNICKRIASEKSNGLKTKAAFLCRYKDDLHKARIPIPTDQTLRKDMKRCQIMFKNGHATISKGNPIFTSLGTSINYFLRQIRLIGGIYDIILINTRSTPLLYPRTLEDFLFPLKELINNNQLKDNTTLQNSDKLDIEVDQAKKITKETIFHLHFILDQKGFEPLIENAFCQDCKDHPYFLYIQTHSYCTIIAFEYKNLNTIMKKIYEIIEFYPFEE